MKRNGEDICGIVCTLVHGAVGTATDDADRSAESVIGGPFFVPVSLFP